LEHIALTEGSSGTIQKMPIPIELRNITTASDINGVWRGVFQLTGVPEFSGVFVPFKGWKSSHIWQQP